MFIAALAGRKRRLSASQIQLRGVTVHNLKEVGLDMPHGQLVVLCGVSGSGKTSLALDTLYAEGQRQYIESLSVYARQFLHQLERPEVDLIEGSLSTPGRRALERAVAVGLKPEASGT